MGIDSFKKLECRNPDSTPTEQNVAIYRANSAYYMLIGTLMLVFTGSYITVVCWIIALSYIAAFATNNCPIRQEICTA